MDLFIGFNSAREGGQGLTDSAWRLSCVLKNLSIVL